MKFQKEAKSLRFIYVVCKLVLSLPWPVYYLHVSTTTSTTVVAVAEVAAVVVDDIQTGGPGNVRTCLQNIQIVGS